MEDKVKQVIVVRTDLNMRKGKMIAQGAHASMMFMTKGLVQEPLSALQPGMYRLFGLFTSDEIEWIGDKFTKIVVGVGSKEELLELHKQATEAGLFSHYVEDEGLTEFAGQKTITALVIGPARSSLIDPITGHLKLL